jgi:hypothetical protein
MKSKIARPKILVLILGFILFALLAIWKVPSFLTRDLYVQEMIAQQQVDTARQDFQANQDPQEREKLKKELDDAQERLFQRAKQRLQTEEDSRKSIMQMIGGIIFLVGLSFTYKNIQVLQDRHLTERFSKAIDHLGSEHTSLQLGGIYALERIAKDSPKDYETIMQVLSAFVRDKAKRIIKDGWDEYVDKDLPIQIQSTLTVIERNNRSLSMTDLCFTNLSKAYLRRANLGEVNFRGTDLRNANLSGANLNRANLSQANLIGAKLVGTDLGGANLNEAKLGGADLRGANLSGADLFGADLLNVRNVTKEQIERATNIEKALLDSQLIKSLSKLNDMDKQTDYIGNEVI